MSADPLQRVDLGQEATRHVEFSYSVKWLATDVPFAERMHRCAIRAAQFLCAQFVAQF